VGSKEKIVLTEGRNLRREKVKRGVDAYQIGGADTKEMRKREIELNPLQDTGGKDRGEGTLLSRDA